MDDGIGSGSTNSIDQIGVSADRALILTQKPYIVCTIKSWNVAAFARHSSALPGTWHLVDRREDLSMDFLRQKSPRYIFFPHWSWLVPPEITEHYECVCFHMSDVPYGRGGSPLQNLIVRGHKETVLTALRMGRGLDDGPVYAKRPLSLEGRAEAIFERAADLSYELIREIVSREPVPVPQHGDPVVFQRRKPEQSELPQDGSLIEMFDFIRMLDAPTYPRAFLDWGEWRLEFDHSSLDDEGVRASVRLYKRRLQ